MLNRSEFESREALSIVPIAKPSRILDLRHCRYREDTSARANYFATRTEIDLPITKAISTFFRLQGQLYTISNHCFA